MSKDRREALTQDLLRKSRNWLAELEKTDRLHSQITTGTGRDIEESIREDEMRAISLEYGLQIDGYVDIRLSDDRMECLMDLYPPNLQGRFPDISDIHKGMGSVGVSAPLNGTVITGALEELRDRREPVFDVVIVRGSRPVSRIPEHLVLDRSLIGRHAPEEKGGRMDHRLFTPFHVVSEGQVIGRVEEEQPGQDGRTADGTAIPFDTIPRPSLQIGENVELQDGELIAMRSGRIVVGDDTVSVREILEVAGDVGYGTGHIDFPGDVVIRGIVRDGFSVVAGQDVIAADTLDATRIEAGGKVEAAKGLIGRQEGVVRAGTGVSAKFIERCYVETRGPVKFDIGLLNSVVHTGQSVQGGDKSIIIGGKVVCRDGVNVHQIGNASETRTAIIAGVDYDVMNKLEWIRDQNIEITDRINAIRRQKDITGDETGELEAMERRFRDSLLKLNESSHDLVARLHQAEDARIIVRGTAYPGTYVEICHVSYVVERPITKVILLLDKARGIITVEKLTRPG